MSELLVVSCERALVGDDSARLIKAKVAALGYGRISIRTSSGFTSQSTTGPLGGVTCPADAQRLIAALGGVFPGEEFAVEQQDYPEAHFVFHAP